MGSSPAGLKGSSIAVQGTQETHTCAGRHRSPQGWPGDSVGQQNLPRLERLSKWRLSEDTAIRALRCVQGLATEREKGLKAKNNARLERN